MPERLVVLSTLVVLTGIPAGITWSKGQRAAFLLGFLSWAWSGWLLPAGSLVPGHGGQGASMVRKNCSARKSDSAPGHLHCPEAGRGGGGLALRERLVGDRG